MAARLEGCCFYWLHRRQHAARLPSGNPSRPSSRDHAAGRGARRQSAARDENAVLGRLGATWVLFPIQGGDGRPVPALTPGDIPLQWSHGGRYVYTVASVDGARQAAVDVFRVELASGSRTLWKTLTPSDPVGVEDMRETLVITRTRSRTATPTCDGLATCSWSIG